MASARFTITGILLGVLVATVSAIGLLWTVGTVIAIATLLATLLIANQEKILYIPVVMGYRTVADNPEGYRSPLEWGASFKNFYLTTPDKETIHGWHIHVANPTATIIFCHENAGNIGLRVNNLVAMSKQLHADVVAFDYRGYGESSGRPSEAGLMMDTKCVFEYVVDKLEAKNILLYGRSLGGAVALQFAATVGGDSSKPHHPPIKGLIVENTFTSISDMIGCVFPFLNFSFVKKYCLRLKWENHLWMRLIECPVMLISGLQDELVPASQMADLKKICDAKNIKTTLLTVPNGTHNDTWVVGGQKYWIAVKDFVRSCFRVRVSNLPWAAAPADVLSMFSKWKPVDCMRVTSETGKDLGQSFVSFNTVEDAIGASQEMNGKFFTPPNYQSRLHRMAVHCDFQGPRIVQESYMRAPSPRRLIKQVRDKAIGAKYPTDPVMSNTNESHMIRRYKTGGLPRSNDRQR